MRKKRILATLVCLCMMAALLPSVALAATATSVIVGGKTLDGTNHTYATTDSNGVVTLQPSYTESDPWNVKFQNGVLTLKGATVAGAVQTYDISSSDKNYAIYAAGELKLELVDNNTVYSTDGADIRAGIRVAYSGATNNGSLTIEGSGSLRAYAAAGGNHVHDGILVSGSVTINSGTITAEGRSTDGNSYGVRAVTNFVMNGGTLTAIGGDVVGNQMSIGVYASGTVAINGGTLNAAGGTSVTSSYGVSSGILNGIIINASADGQVKVTAQTTDTSGSNYHRAFNSSPVISDGAYYTWSLTENNPAPTSSTIAPYSWESTQTFTELVLGQIVATPTFSLAAGAYTDPQSVEITCATAGATIYYTTNGNDPTEADTPFAAGTPIAVTSTTTIKATAFKSGMAASGIASATYTIQAQPSATSGDSDPYPTLYPQLGAQGGELTGNGLRFVSSGAYNQFESVWMDGSLVAPAHYILEPDSTVVTLRPAYLATLANGTHTLRINFADGYTRAAFTTPVAMLVPKTGDMVSLLPCALLLLAAGVFRKKV